MSGVPAPLQRPGFRALWGAQIVSGLGDRLYELAVIWYVFEATGDPVVVSIVTFASVGSAAVASVPAGTVIDRVDRRTILIVSDVVRGVAVLAVPLLGSTGSLVVLLVAVSVVSGLAEAFFNPARNALIAELMPESELDAANSISLLTRSAGQMLYAVGGVVVGVLGTLTAFYADAASFFVSALLLLAIPHRSERYAPQADPDDLTDASGWLTDFGDAVSLVRAHTLLPAVLGISVVTTFATGPMSVVIPFFMEAVATASSVAFGLVYGAYFVGMFVGGALLNAEERESSARGELITKGTILSGATVVLAAAVAPSAPYPLVTTGVLFALSGVFTMLIKIPIRTLVQSTVPNDDLGKVLAVLNLSMLVAPPVGIAAAGLLVEVVGPVTVLLGQGILVTLAGLGALTTPLWNSEAGQPYLPSD